MLRMEDEKIIQKIVLGKICTLKFSFLLHSKRGDFLNFLHDFGQGHSSQIRIYVPYEIDSAT